MFMSSVQIFTNNFLSGFELFVCLFLTEKTKADCFLHLFFASLIPYLDVS